MPVRRVPLDEVLEAVLAGDVHNGTLMIAVLAASRLRERGWAGLRSVHEYLADAPSRPPMSRSGFGTPDAGSSAVFPCGGVPQGVSMTSCCGPVLTGGTGRPRRRRP